MQETIVNILGLQRSGTGMLSIIGCALQRVPLELAARDIVTHPELVASSGHAYTPSLHFQIEHYLTRLAKDSFLRFRFNFLQSLFGHDVGRLYLRYFTPDIKRTSGSFDPGENREAP